MNFVKTYNNVLTSKQCEDIIQKFEAHPEQHVKTYLPNHMSFTELNINQNKKDWEKELFVLFTTMQVFLEQYKKDLNIDDSVWPKNVGYEQLRMKRYLPDTEDEFKFHVDVTDHASARRFLVYFWYLNDVDVGGETVFQTNRSAKPHMKVRPKTGKLLMFPPLWTHPHIAMPPINNTKYIIGGYLHYV